MRVQITGGRAHTTGEVRPGDNDLDIRTKQYVTASELENGEEVIIRREDGQCLAVYIEGDGFKVRHFAQTNGGDTYFSHKIQINSGFPAPPEVIE